MKITKAEKIWLTAVIIFYVLYNLPFVPSYGNAEATIIHALLTLIPLWVIVYVGLAVTFRKHPLRKTPKVMKEVGPMEEEEGEPVVCVTMTSTESADAAKL